MLVTDYSDTSKSRTVTTVTESVITLEEDIADLEYRKVMTPKLNPKKYDIPSANKLRENLI